MAEVDKDSIASPIMEQENVIRTQDLQPTVECTINLERDTQYSEVAQLESKTLSKPVVVRRVAQLETKTFSYQTVTKSKNVTTETSIQTSVIPFPMKDAERYSENKENVEPENFDKSQFVEEESNAESVGLKVDYNANVENNDGRETFDRNSVVKLEAMIYEITPTESELKTDIAPASATEVMENIKPKLCDNSLVVQLESQMVSEPSVEKAVTGETETVCQSTISVKKTVVTKSAINISSMKTENVANDGPEVFEVYGESQNISTSLGPVLGTIKETVDDPSVQDSDSSIEDLLTNTDTRDVVEINMKPDIIEIANTIESETIDSPISHEDGMDFVKLIPLESEIVTSEGYSNKTAVDGIHPTQLENTIDALCNKLDMERNSESKTTVDVVTVKYTEFKHEVVITDDDQGAPLETETSNIQIDIKEDDNFAVHTNAAVQHVEEKEQNGFNLDDIYKEDYHKHWQDSNIETSEETKMQNAIDSEPIIERVSSLNNNKNLKGGRNKGKVPRVNSNLEMIEETDIDEEVDPSLDMGETPETVNLDMGQVPETATTNDPRIIVYRYQDTDIDTEIRKKEKADRRISIEKVQINPEAEKFNNDSPITEVKTEENESPIIEVKTEENESPITEVKTEENESPITEVKTEETESPITEVDTLEIETERKQQLMHNAKTEVDDTCIQVTENGSSVETEGLGDKEIGKQTFDINGMHVDQQDHKTEQQVIVNVEVVNITQVTHINQTEQKINAIGTVEKTNAIETEDLSESADTAETTETNVPGNKKKKHDLTVIVDMEKANNLSDNDSVNVELRKKDPKDNIKDADMEMDILKKLERESKTELLVFQETRKEHFKSIENLFSKDAWNTIDITDQENVQDSGSLGILKDTQDTSKHELDIVGKENVRSEASNEIKVTTETRNQELVTVTSKKKESVKRRLDMSWDTEKSVSVNVTNNKFGQNTRSHNSILDSDCGLSLLQGLISADMSMGIGVCCRCGEGFGQHQQIVNSNGEVWHPQCFVCAQCFQPFPEGIFYEFEGRKYCEHDFHVLFAPCCGKCGEFIVGRVIKALNNSWHPDCFRCQLCAGPLADSGFVKNAGRALCRECNAKEKARGLGKYVCHKCHSIIEDGHIKYKGEAFHPYHFNCKSCSIELNADAREVNGELYCLRCHDKMGIPICGACRRPIEERVVHALGKAWHVEHFVCAKCEKPFFGTRHYEKKGLAYCEIHYHQLFGNICFTCNNVISGDVFHAFNKAWHVNHFACSICDRKMSQKTKFFEFDLKPVCKFCYEKFPGELKKRLKKAYDEQSKK